MRIKIGGECPDFFKGMGRSEVSGSGVWINFGILVLALSLTACSYVRGSIDSTKDVAGKLYANASHALTEAPNSNDGMVADPPKAGSAVSAQVRSVSSGDLGDKTESPGTKGEIVVRSAPRHLMVSPRTDPIWLWDRPGGPRARAIRIQKVPSGTPGRLLEIEPESKSSSLWAMMGYKNYARQPVRWVKIATESGVGWVRTEFVEAR